MYIKVCSVLYKTQKVNIRLECPPYIIVSIFSLCRERDSNPHSHYWPRDFKSLVSTNSTIAATCVSLY